MDEVIYEWIDRWNDRWANELMKNVSRQMTECRCIERKKLQHIHINNKMIGYLDNKKYIIMWVGNIENILT